MLQQKKCASPETNHSHTKRKKYRSPITNPVTQKLNFLDCCLRKSRLKYQDHARKVNNSYGPVKYGAGYKLPQESQVEEAMPVCNSLQLPPHAH